MLVKVPGKDTDSVVTAFTQHVRILPGALMKTLTWDRGAELTGHKRFTIATDVKVYFCDRKSHGNGGPTRTRTVPSGSTSQKAPSFPSTRKKASTPSHCG